MNQIQGRVSEATANMSLRKTSVITFKAEPGLAELLRGLPNRSEFIRAAVLAAFESACPLCQGTGILTPGQKDHWDRFARKHSLEECADCHAYHIVCARDSEERGTRDVER